MDKSTLIALVLCVLLVGGAIFASAEYLEEDKIEIVNDYEQPVCGPSSCGQQCGGNCGIPSCGCS